MTVRINAAACALFVSLASSAALAQTPPPYAARNWGPAPGLPASEIAAIVRSSGLTPTQPPVRIGGAYVLRAVDRYGRPMRIAVDARSGDILSVRPAAALQPWGYGPYRPYGAYGPYGPNGPYPPYAARGPTPPDPYDDDAAQAWPAARPNPPEQKSPDQKSLDQKSAAATPANPPVPRPKPAKPAAVKPAPSAPAAAAPSSGQTATSRPVVLPPENPPAKAEPGSQPPAAAPASPALPPVTPLE